MSCDASCDHGHMPLHYPRNQRKKKRKIKLRKIDKNTRVQVYYNISFHNKSLLLVEHNYKIHSKKILVIIHVLEE